MNLLSKTVLSGIPKLMMGSVRAEGAGKLRVGRDLTVCLWGRQNGPVDKFYVII